MSAHTDKSTPLARRSGLLAALLAASALLAGCSAASDSAAEYSSEADYGSDIAYEGGGVGAAAPEAADDGANTSLTTERSVIITGSLYMTVEDPIAIADKAVALVQRAGGRIDARNETAPDERSGGSATLTMRIPSDKLDGVVDDLRALGTVDQLNTDSYDVTNQVTDLEASISTLRASTARIEALLTEAKSISDIITLENELDRRQSELEGLVARQRGLTDQVSMSTIDLSLTTEPVIIIEPPVVDDSPKNFWDGLVSGWGALVTFISAALIIVGVLLPWIALIALIGYVAIYTRRAIKSRGDNTAGAPVETSAPLAATPRAPKAPK